MECTTCNQTHKEKSICTNWSNCITPKEQRKDIRRRIDMIESNLRELGYKTSAMKKDAHSRLAELKAEYRDSFKKGMV